MQSKIAVVTASGKAYYRLVNELRKENVSFVIAKPGETLPLDVKVAIITEGGKGVVPLNGHCQKVLLYNETTSPSLIIEEALLAIRGKDRYESLVVGVDPGKNFGIAVLGDGRVLETKSVSSETAAVEVMGIIKRFKSEHTIVKVGNGADDYRSKLITILDRELPPNAVMESVEEMGTTKNGRVSRRRNFKDASSAVQISIRRGRKITRNAGGGKV